MRDFAISALREPPFPTGRHGATDQVASESIEWARTFGLVDSSQRVRRLQRADAAGLAGRACPDGSVEGLRLLTDLISWLFVMDDACDEDGLGADPVRLGPAISTLLDVLDRCGDPDVAPPAVGPLGDALHDLCRRTRLHDHAGLLLRFVSQMREYLLALLWEAGNRERRRVPEVAEYVQLRRHIGGVHPCLTLTDLASTRPSGPAQRANPALVALDLLAVDLVCWCNDLFSYGKESQADPDAHNLVTVIAQDSDADEVTALRSCGTPVQPGVGDVPGRGGGAAAAGDDGIRDA